MLGTRNTVRPPLAAALLALLALAACNNETALADGSIALDTIEAIDHGSREGDGTAGSDSTPDDTTGAPDAAIGIDVLKGYWVWEQRVMGTVVQPPAPLDAGQMKIAFGTGNNKCHYIWNETTGSDFHTECTYSVSADMVTYNATADADGTAAGYSCAHPDWTSWNDRPAVQWGRYKFVGDRLWLGVNAYWGGANGQNGSCKRFPFWESPSQAQTEEAWIVFKPVSRTDWYGTYAISTTCQGTPTVCAQWPGCGPGDKAYVD